MKETRFAACILVLGLIIAALLNGGIYQMLRGDGIVIWRINRLTGAVSACDYDGCLSIKEIKSISEKPNASAGSARPKETPYDMRGRFRKPPKEQDETDNP